MTDSKLTKLNQIEAYSKALKCLNTLYDSSEGKKFVHHLIYSYLSGTVTYILYSKSAIYDCITGSLLDTIYESKSDVDPIIRDLISKYYSESDESTKLNISISINNMIVDELNNSPRHRLAVRSNLSNKILGTEELQALTDFIKDQVSIKNKVIIGMVRYAKGEFKTDEIKKEPRASKSNKPTLGSDENLRSKLESALKN